MGSQIITTVSFGDERTELNILDCHLFATNTTGKNNFQLLHIRVMPQCSDLLHFLLIQVIIQSLQHSVESNLRSVWNKREDRMIDIIIDSFQYFRNQLFAQPFPFFINIDVTATGEIDTFEGTSLIFARLIDLRSTYLSLFANQQCLPRLQFLDFLKRNIQSCLDNRTFGSKNSYLVILIPKCRPDAPRVTDSERFTASGQSTNNIPPIPFATGSTQYVCQINMFFYIMRDAHARKPFGFGKIEYTLHFTVKTVSHLFQHDICIGIFTRMLTNGSDTGKYFVHIRHIEVSAKSEILGTPVISS